MRRCLLAGLAAVLLTACPALRHDNELLSSAPPSSPPSASAMRTAAPIRASLFQVLSLPGGSVSNVTEGPDGVYFMFAKTESGRADGVGRFNNGSVTRGGVLP